jgi:hypothetical protein
MEEEEEEEEEEVVVVKCRINKIMKRWKCLERRTQCEAAGICRRQKK